jgi:hypothetical protein
MGGRAKDESAKVLEQAIDDVDEVQLAPLGRCLKRSCSGSSDVHPMAGEYE